MMKTTATPKNTPSRSQDTPSSTSCPHWFLVIRKYSTDFKRYATLGIPYCSAHQVLK